MLLPKIVSSNPCSQVADLEEELGRVSERLSETEAEAMSQQVCSYIDVNNPVAGRNEMDDVLPTRKGVV